MPQYFADTSFWIALVDRRDAFHARAIEWSQVMSGLVMTTEAVFLETANAFSKPQWRQQVVDLVNHCAQRDDMEIVPFSSLLWEEAWSLFGCRLDKSWSLTDCISFVVMDQRKLTEALTADAHFQQAGFRALLLDSQRRG